MWYNFKLKYVFSLVPQLSTSSSILVGLTSDLVNGNGPSIICMPSDLRAPVTWNIAKDFPDILVSYFPDGLYHTVTFISAPQQTFMIKCDFINVEDEQTSIDPQEVIVRFISSMLWLIKVMFLFNWLIFLQFQVQL